MAEELNNENEAGKLDLYRFLREFQPIVFRFIWIPVILAILLGARSYLSQKNGYVPRYRAEATFSISVTGTSMIDMAGSTNYYDKATAEQLATIFPYLLSTDLMQSKLQKALNSTYVNGSISATTVSNTNLFTLSVTSTSAQDAYHVLMAVIDVYPSIANYVVGTTAMNMIIEPSVPVAPYNSDSISLKSVIRQAIYGIALGIVILCLITLTRRSIFSKNDVHKMLNQRCLGEVPQVTFKKRRNSQTSTAVHVLNSRISTGFKESIRSMRVKFLHYAEERNCRVIMVTSTIPGEGKTTISANLALALSQNGHRVILIDMDLRKPSVKKALGITIPSKGVPEYLEEGDKIQSYLRPIKDTGLFIMAGDKAVSNPREQLNSHKLNEMVRAFSALADYVILDSPPAGILADSISLSRLADGAVYVVGEGVTQAQQILDGLQSLGGTGCKLLGCVLNRMHTGVLSAYGYGYGYGGYGGYSSKKHQSRSSGKSSGTARKSSARQPASRTSVRETPTEQAENENK